MMRFKWKVDRGDGGLNRKHERSLCGLAKPLQLFVILFSSNLMADDMGVLGFFFVFWPASLLCVIILIGLTVANGHQLLKKVFSSKALWLSAATIIMAIAAMIAFPVILHGTRYQRLADEAIIPVEIAGCFSLISAVWLLIRSIIERRRRK